MLGVRIINTLSDINTKDIVIDCFLTEQKKLFITALAITKNYHSAEDAVQETFIKIMKKNSQLEDVGFAKTWMTRILMNECKDISKKNRKEILNLEEISETAFADFNDEEIHFFELISTLNNKEKQILTLKYFNGFELSDISLILKLPLSTVKSRLYRALEKMRKDWSD
jgi:RNA polymerase sigma-70 factor, ECF subfamily